MNEFSLNDKMSRRAESIRAQGLEPTALIHLRKSVISRKRTDQDSEQRQMENCARYCERAQWQSEVYSDFKEGHHSGRSDRKRPAWAALRAQLDRPEVIAVIVEILSRAYRNVRLMLDLLDNELATRGIFLIVVMLPDVDFSTPAGRSVLISLANADELTSRMAGETMKASIASYRRSGRWWGMPPYGLEPDTSKGKGYEYRLRRARTGIWWLGEVNQSEFVEGTAEKPPRRSATWRGDYDAVIALYEKYVNEDIGGPSLADYLNAQGYRYRNEWHRNDKRVNFTPNTTRQILMSWRVFAGYVPDASSRRKTAKYHTANFKPLAEPKLLRRVGVKQHARSFSRQNHRAQKHAPLLLQTLLRCARCGEHFYAHPARGAGKRDYYYHYTVDCRNKDVAKHPRRYIDAHDFDEAVLADLDRLLALPNAHLIRIVKRQQRKSVRVLHPQDKIRTRIQQMEREWRALKLSEVAIREMRTAMERELLPKQLEVNSVDELLPGETPTPEQLVKQLRQIGTLLRTRRVEQPHEANQAISSLFRCILVQDGSVVEYQPYEWCAPFFEATGKVRGTE